MLSNHKQLYIIIKPICDDPIISYIVYKLLRKDYFQNKINKFKKAFNSYKCFAIREDDTIFENLGREELINYGYGFHITDTPDCNKKYKAQYSDHSYITNSLYDCIRINYLLNENMNNLTIVQN